MYAIRVDSERQALLVSVSGRLTTEEAQRGVIQAFALAEAVRINSVCCDVTELERGPGSILPIAALIALRFRPEMRVSFVAGAYHARALRRLISFTGIRGALRVFGSTMAAEGWLLPGAEAAVESTSAREHRRLRESRVVPPTGGAVAAAGKRTVHPAA
jgi:hypothetical protein